MQREGPGPGAIGAKCRRSDFTLVLIQGPSQQPTELIQRKSPETCVTCVRCVCGLCVIRVCAHAHLSPCTAFRHIALTVGDRPPSSLTWAGQPGEESSAPGWAADTPNVGGLRQGQPGTPVQRRDLVQCRVPPHRRGVGRGSPGGVDSSGWTLQRDGWLRGVTEAAGGSSQTVQMDGWPGRMALTREHPLLGGGRHPAQNVESADS